MATIMDLARDIETDAEVLGWDQPAKRWEVRGTLEDPYLALTETGWELDLPDPRQLPAGVLGTAFVSEAIRHLTYEEATSEMPDLVTGAKTIMKMVGSPESAEAMLRSQWERFTTEYSPLETPHKETRCVVIVVARDVVILRRDRAAGAEVDVRVDGPVPVVVDAAIKELLTLASKPR